MRNLLNKSEPEYLELIKSNAYDKLQLNEILFLSSKYGYVESIKYLIEQGADIHAESDKALRVASSEKHIDVVNYLISQEADASVCKDETKHTSVVDILS